MRYTPDEWGKINSTVDASFPAIGPAATYKVGAQKEDGAHPSHAG
jgi:hypothetical protein